MKLATIILLSFPVLVGAADVSISMDVRTRKADATNSTQRFYNDVTLRNHTKNSQQYDVTVLALELRGDTYICKAVDRGQLTVLKYSKAQAQYRGLGETARTKWTWLVLVMQDGKLVAHHWQRCSMRLDPELFVDLKVGEIVTKDPK